ncbi:vanillate O-demethylase ferredoxin subunit [Acidovorax sp. 69]|uniref:PDR/VanB family oxidoreductase n=1 Tax=Acidovorax sp. 69 TaxID=2035202 RepID=UPI000C24BEBB|nr:PDR/VanB family oxidoreductase [Acidovorax sp. 69]PJI95852.1 vanillate O-demethylase ferredoxin subunit [Acidovorax sp. 69]
MNPLKVIVRSRRAEAEGICSFELAHPEGLPLPAFTAGAHIDVHVTPEIVRQYSLCGQSANGDFYRIAVLLEAESRGGSAGMHELVQVGQLLTISAPRNHFELDRTAQHSMLFAGGIGITPILAMANDLHAQGKSFQLHYCGRAADRMAFLAEISHSSFASHVFVHTSTDAQRFNATPILVNPQHGGHLYVCGPVGFMEHVLDAARASGWSEAQLHREFFAGTAKPLDTDGTFAVRLASSGTTYQIPKGKSVIEVLTSAGIDVPYSCESGVCGTCLTPVLEGVPDHRDTFLTEAERAANDQFTPCCSRALTPLLVLDL